MSVGLKFVAAFGVMLFVLFVATNTSAREDTAAEHSYIPHSGFVPDERTALLIAEAVLVPIYGQATIDEQKPLVATHSDGKWIVSGQLDVGLVGGVATIVIDGRSGQILRVTHSR